MVLDHVFYIYQEWILICMKLRQSDLHECCSATNYTVACKMSEKYLLVNTNLWFILANKYLNTSFHFSTHVTCMMWILCNIFVSKYYLMSIYVYYFCNIVFSLILHHHFSFIDNCLGAIYNYHQFSQMSKLLSRDGYRHLTTGTICWKLNSKQTECTRSLFCLLTEQQLQNV